ncbi:hypothetical protein ID0084_00810 [Helicobacter pylori]
MIKYDSKIKDSFKEIKGLCLSLPDLKKRLCGMRNSLNTMHSSCSCSAKEHRVLEKMHAIILKGVDNLTERLGDDLKDGDSRVYVPIKYISGLYDVGNMKPDELCLLFAKCLNIPVRNPETIKTKGKRKSDNFFLLSL